MENKFKVFLQNIVPITDNEFTTSLKKFKKITLKKGEYFIEEGKTSKQIGFINSGILRTYYINNKAEEVTSCFCIENNLTASYKSFILQAPSNIAIIALEETEILTISFNDIQELYKESTNWQTIGRLIAEKELILMEQYASVLNNETAKEKYLRFLKEQPNVLKTAKIEDIASYLGISRRTLSRIRKEIFD